MTDAGYRRSAPSVTALSCAVADTCNTISSLELGIGIGDARDSDRGLTLMLG
jgi:hypothetical protein